MQGRHSTQAENVNKAFALICGLKSRLFRYLYVFVTIVGADSSISIFTRALTWFI